ncbi:hypothetical protein F383_23480 [Gossypium arboreum]|uniref:Uncharacterized protein n=1 Tax=Gossypium arboreum TaxID=29729 RepID=A0A0B0MK48_GOSAR|nr:hypothetical protein F383_23480 [Gossypium arboreum]
MSIVATRETYRRKVFILDSLWYSID